MISFSVYLAGEYEGDHFTIIQGHTPAQPAHLYGLVGFITPEGGVMIQNTNQPGTAIKFSHVECFIEEGGGEPLVDRRTYLGEVAFGPHLAHYWSVIVPRDGVPGEDELRGGEGMYVPVKRPEFHDDRKDAVSTLLQGEYELTALERFPALLHGIQHWRYDPDVQETLVPTDPDNEINLEDPQSYYVDLSRTPTGERGFHWLKFEPNQQARAGGSRVQTGWRHGSSEVWGSGTFSSAHYEHGTGFLMAGLFHPDLKETQQGADTLFLGWLQQAQRCAMGLAYSGPSLGSWVDEKDVGVARGTHSGKREPAHSGAKQFPLQAHLWHTLTDDPQIKAAVWVSMQRLLSLRDWSGNWGARIPARDGLEGLRYAFLLSHDERYKAKAEDYGQKVMALPSRRDDGLWPNMGNNGAAETSPWMQAKLLRALWRWHNDHGLWPDERERLLDTMEALWELGTYEVPGQEPGDVIVERDFLEPGHGTPYWGQEFQAIPVDRITDTSSDSAIRQRLQLEAVARKRWGGHFSVATHRVRQVDPKAAELYSWVAMRYRFRAEDGFWVGRGPDTSTNPQLGAWGLPCWRILAQERGVPWAERLVRAERSVWDTIGSSWYEVTQGTFYATDEVGWEWAAWGVGGAPKRWLAIKEGMLI